MKHKSFAPKVDTKRRLVLTRFYTGIGDSNSFCYKVERITKSGTVDKRFKSLFAFGTDDFSSVKEFKHSLTVDEEIETLFNQNGIVLFEDFYNIESSSEEEKIDFFKKTHPVVVAYNRDKNINNIIK